MVHLVIIRGPAAVGKTTIARKLVKVLPSAAYVSEDHFRGWLQVKRGEHDPKTHRIATKLIQNLIDKLLSFDKYKFIVIDGLFPVQSELKKYESYAKKRKYSITIFQLHAPKHVLLKRNLIERGHIVRKAAIIHHTKLFRKPPAQAICLSTEEKANTVVTKIQSCLQKTTK